MDTISENLKKIKCYCKTSSNGWHGEIHLNGTDNVVTLSDVYNVVKAHEILTQNCADGWCGEIHLNGTDNAVTLSDVYNVVDVTALNDTVLTVGTGKFI